MDQERGHGSSRVFLYCHLETALAAGIWRLFQKGGANSGAYEVL